MGRIQKLVAVLMVLISLGLGWYAWVLGKRTLSTKPVESAPPRLSVVVAAKPIPAGTPISKEAVKLEAMTVRPDGAFETVASVEGKIPAESILAGEPIFAQRMHGLDKGIVSAVNPGERAVALKVDEVSGVGNRLNPRDVVDVFVTMRRNNDEIAESQGQLLLAGVRVLAVGSRSVQGRDEKPVETTLQPGGKYTSEPPRTVVLAVPLKEVGRLALMAETGKILLALRNPLDRTPLLADPAPVAGVSSAIVKATLRQVALGQAEKPSGDASGSTHAGRKPEPEVDIIRGLKRHPASAN